MKSVLMCGTAFHSGSDFPVSCGLMAFVCFLFVIFWGRVSSSLDHILIVMFVFCGLFLKFIVYSGFRSFAGKFTESVASYVIHTKFLPQG